MGARGRPRAASGQGGPQGGGAVHAGRQCCPCWDAFELAMVSGRAFQTNVHVHRPGCCPSGLKGLLGLEFGPSEVDRAFRWVRRVTVLPRDLSVCVWCRERAEDVPACMTLCLHLNPEIPKQLNSLSSLCDPWASAYILLVMGSSSLYQQPRKTLHGSWLGVSRFQCLQKPLGLAQVSHPTALLTMGPLRRRPSAKALPRRVGSSPVSGV